MISFLFVLVICIIGYTYIGYPLLIFVLAKLFIRKNLKDETLLPSVAFIISAYNEETVIFEKLTNTKQIDYPTEKIQIYINIEKKQTFIY